MAKFQAKNITLLSILIILAAVILLLVVSFNYANKNQIKDNNKQNAQTQLDARELCIKKCNEMSNEGIDLSAGPCILDPIPEMSEWVCDVAHNPRQEIDNARENQCDAWHNNSAKHFVEVTPSCEFLKSV